MKKLMFMLLFANLLDANTPISKSLSLDEALTMLQINNLQIKSASFDVDIARENTKAVSGMNWGKLSFTQDAIRSNDAGNVFGFKLSSREASFGDFGFSEFNQNNPNILTLQPNDLNHPKDRNFFQSKLKYEIPLFTGFVISNYANLMNEITKMKTLQKKELINEKVYQLKKSYYDMALLEDSVKNLNVILANIKTLQNVTQSMIEVGYAKHIDLLEVKAKKGAVHRLLLQMKSSEQLLYHYISFLLNNKIKSIKTPTSEITMPKYSDNEILSKNIDIQKASVGLNIREDNLKISKAMYYPTIGAFGEIATADNDFLSNAISHKSYTVGARLTWNLFNGGIDSAKVEKSKLEHLKTLSQVELAKQGILLKLAKIKTEINSADEEITSLEKELEYANAIYKNYEGRYKEKLSSMSDVIIKQSAQIKKILELQVAKNRRNEKIFALEKLANGDK